MTFNIHQLTHISQSVADWGPLWAHSGYTFESGNGQIVKTVHAAKGVINQVCRNLSMTESLIMMEQHISAKEHSPVKEYCFYLENRCTQKTYKMGINRYFGRHSAPDRAFIADIPLQDRDHYKAYKKLIKNQCVYKSSKKVLQRSDNSFDQTNNQEYIHITQFIVDTIDNREYILCKKIEVENTFGLCTTLKEIVRIEENCSIIETADISTLCVCLTVDRKQYISAIPHIYWFS